MIKIIKQIIEFRKRFGYDIPSVPSFPDQDKIDFALGLIDEELKELKIGVKNRDMPNVFKEACDLMYVLVQFIVSVGLAGRFQGGFDEVHTSNMSKGCESHKDGYETKEMYRAKGVNCEIIAVSGSGTKCNVYTMKGKLLKSKASYQEANMNKFLDERAV